MITLTKMHGCRNVMLIVDEFDRALVEDDAKRYFVEEVCEQESDVDGVVFISRSRIADARFRYFDRDGTEESMCGNGIRCFSRYANDRGYIGNTASIESRAGTKYASIDPNLIEIDMGVPHHFLSPEEIKAMNIPSLEGYEASHINVGISHIVVLKDKIDPTEPDKKGAEIRHDEKLLSALGESEVQVNFVKQINDNSIEIVTYEAGVERVTKACGTGATASAYISHLLRNATFPIATYHQGGTINVDYRRTNGASHLYMKGPADYIGNVDFDTAKLNRILSLKRH